MDGESTLSDVAVTVGAGDTVPSPGVVSSVPDAYAILEVPRRPGPPKGSPKVPGSGRRRGVKNRRTVEVEAVMRPMMPRVCRKLRVLLDSSDPVTVFKASSLVLAYLYGRPVERKEVSNPDGTLTPRLQIINERLVLEAGRRIERVIETNRDRLTHG